MDPIFYWAVLLQCIICSVGLLFNGFLVYVIIRNRHLRTTCCSIFILFLAINDCLAEFSLISLPTVLTFFDRQIPLKICFFVEVYGPTAQNNILNLLLLISLDRCFSIIFPLKYKFITNQQKCKYICAVVGLLFIEPIIMVYLYYDYVINDANVANQVYCFPTDIVGPVALNYSLILTLFQNIGTAAVYCALGLLIKFKCIKMMQDKVDRRVLRSLFVLASVTFFCWFPTPLFGNFIMPNLSPLVQNVAFRAIQQLTKIGQAANAPILYFCSSDYRKAIQKEFANITRCAALNTNNNTNNEHMVGNGRSNSNGRQNSNDRTIVNNFVGE